MQTQVQWVGWLALLTPAVLMFDFWNWSGTGPLLFGWIPVGLWWPAVMTVLAAPLYWFAFKYVWPDDEPALPAMEDGE